MEKVDFLKMVKELLPHRENSKSTDKLIAILCLVGALDTDKVDFMEITWHVIEDNCGDPVAWVPELKVQMIGSSVALDDGDGDHVHLP